RIDRHVMDPFHEHLAHIGLAAANQYGFALAGGYAMQANGFLTRPSEDVDLFMAWQQRGDFDTAVTALIEAYGADGLTVPVDQRWDTFCRLYVGGSGGASKVELSVDWRANEPIWMAVGPVLHPDDAVANKMCALFGRAEARDFIDVDAAVTSGRYSREDLLGLAVFTDGGFDRRIFADVLAQAPRIADSLFAAYGVDGRDLD